ncbi:hypothetical protein H4P12_08435 [Paracoccus sp. 11-3]|uniref:Phage protein (N4 Gp49/phage Sf6 gene 66) family protein n=1 Tax=Paracoccus amoyensis TaxID=2760093 RepID=A0A926G931_9RHOB|nr:Gp49 family protein [Paracoccus amoyensis]MBC9246738.1 hypothetical protein [Paracoccus amoyensis]
MESLNASDRLAASVQKTPNRISLQYLEARIVAEEYLHPTSQPHMTLCVLTLVNGFSVVGQSAPADPENFNADVGHQFARSDAIGKLWPLEGYLLREKLAAE